ncbi:MAG: MBOAT family protein [Candidatus Thiodiazotropha sp.]
MVFSTPVFLFGFLPVVLLFYYLSPTRYKNRWLLIASLFFYAWGEVFYVLVMLISIVANFLVGRKIDQNHTLKKQRDFYLALGISINLFLLITYKYANFIVDNLNFLLNSLYLPSIDIPSIHLPLGISFFTFQAISYLVDVHRREVPAQKKLLDLGLYISLFPQLIAGPIIRYHDVSAQISDRQHSLELFASGTIRFIYGLAKKVLLANPLAEIADSVFASTGNDLTMPLAWLGILAYTLQIYFDFSGYSDMAIGLGRMFGFRFHENFNYPYIATSLRTFWRRWHISLSSWFRDYVYIPMGGSRVSTLRVYRNLFLVFILTGFWHGASWNFLIWGLLHGVFLAVEHAGFSNLLEKLWKPIQHAYLLFIVMISWVFFRADTITQAIDYLIALFDIRNFATSELQYMQVVTYESLWALPIALLLAMPVYPVLKQWLQKISGQGVLRTALLIDLPRLALLSSLLFLCMVKVASSTYNPFIYFRF